MGSELWKRDNSAPRHPNSPLGAASSPSWRERIFPTPGGCAEAGFVRRRCRRRSPGRWLARRRGGRRLSGHNRSRAAARVCWAGRRSRHAERALGQLAGRLQMNRHSQDVDSTRVIVHRVHCSISWNCQCPASASGCSQGGPQCNAGFASNKGDRLTERCGSMQHSRMVNRLTHLLGGELGVAGVEAAAEEATAVDQVEAEGEEHHALRFERRTTQRSECLFRTVRHRLEVAHLLMSMAEAGDRQRFDECQRRTLGTHVSRLTWRNRKMEKVQRLTVNTP